MEKGEIHLQAPAKINLILRVLGRRTDGYHDLETWMQKIGLVDHVYLKITDFTGIKLRCSDPGLPVDEGNLVWRAAALFFSKSRAAHGLGADIYLEKNIPVSAGLGGGSSDAGTVLKGLNTCFDNEFNTLELIEMAKSLGADVPFFVTDMGAVLASGIGDKMVEVPSLDDYFFILINPGFFVSTAWVFNNFTLTRTDKNSTLIGPVVLRHDGLEVPAMENDLEAVTVGHYPVIGQIKEILTEAGAIRALMSGSGPTVFGIFNKSNGNQKIKVKDTLLPLRSQFGEKVFVVEAWNGV